QDTPVACVEESLIGGRRNWTRPLGGREQAAEGGTVMEISLSRQQFEALLKVVYLGDWMVNAIRASGSYIPEFEDLDQFLLALGHRSSFEDVVEFEPVLSQFFLEDEVYETLQLSIDDYDY